MPTAMARILDAIDAAAAGMASAMLLAPQLEAEGIATVEVVPEEPLLPHKAHLLVQCNGGLVAYLRLQDDLAIARLSARQAPQLAYARAHARSPRRRPWRP